MSGKTWGRTETAFTFHSFKADGTAICRSNIKAQADGTRRTEGQVDSMISDSPHLFRKCTACEKKEAAHRARVEDSMAPANPYDQVCEGIVTPEAEAAYAEYLAETDLAVSEEEVAHLADEWVEVCNLIPARVASPEAPAKRASYTAQLTDIGEHHFASGPGRYIEGRGWVTHCFDCGAPEGQGRHFYNKGGIAAWKADELHGEALALDAVETAAAQGVPIL